ncbi:Aste57867_20127 [Aphanomyces stellatus]|uniref:Aste57867_20127 protein n=1 Tax=Aphanomyces stellatus TaxID=120398 RepID=A0A485LEE1_9STRA|nr:hypothetical protein As57867_020061 [Aphanomyces stellatus]VFT96822.1 Aste57867_20127 [Aphanomyces stellatus]
MAAGDVRYQGMLWLACSFLVILFLDSIQEVTLLQKIVLVVWCFLGKVYLHDLHAVAVTPAKSPYPMHSPRRRAMNKSPSQERLTSRGAAAMPAAPAPPPSLHKSFSLNALNNAAAAATVPSQPHLKRSSTTSLSSPVVNPQEPIEPESPVTDSEGDMSPKSDDMNLLDEDNNRLDTFKSMLNLAESDDLYTDDYLMSVMNVPGRAMQYAADKLNRIITWRKEYRANDITYDEVGGQMATCSMYWFGYDYDNRPILWLRPKKKNWAKMNNDLEVRANVFILELAVRKFMPPGISAFTLILDCKDVGYRETDLSLTKTLVQVTTGNYPDRIGCIGIGPLTMLVKALTRVLAPLLPPRLRDKARFMDNPFQTLSDIMPEALIPVYMGGTNPHFLNAEHDEGRFDFEFMCAEMRRRMDAIQE